MDRGAQHPVIALQRRDFERDHVLQRRVDDVTDGLHDNAVVIAVIILRVVRAALVLGALVAISVFRVEDPRVTFVDQIDDIAV